MRHHRRRHPAALGEVEVGQFLECLELRAKDLDFGRGEIRVRRGKAQQDRVTLLPVAGRAALKAHMGRVRERHRRDLAASAGYVDLTSA